MTCRYNKGIIIHIIITLFVAAITYLLLGMIGGIIFVLVFSISGTVKFNCYRIDINEYEMTIYQIYGGRTNLLWNEIASVDIGENTVERSAVGSFRNMTMKLHEQKEFVVNIEPVEREALIMNIELICTTKGIPFTKQ